MLRTIAILYVFILLPPNLFSQYYEIHCKHFIYGYPVGSPITNDLIIRDSYALSSNDSTKFADWVCYFLDSTTISGPSLSERQWKTDPWLDNDETLELEDYRGANEALNADRGHQAPLANFKGNRDWFTSNYLSNITPQDSKLNRGLWKNLEDLERKIVARYNEVYVMTGTLFKREMPKLPNADEPHVIPSGYWKIIVVQIKKEDLLLSAFIFDQKQNPSNELIDYCVSVREIERRAGLDFFNLLKTELQEKFETNKDCSWLFN